VADSSAADRVRTLLLRGDNVLKHGRSQEKAREAFEQAREAAKDPSVDPRVRELVERRLQSLDEST
jgi:predicted negative regulator of RcsB-dependent stress response